MNHSILWLWILGAAAIIAFIIVLILRSLKKKLIQTVSKSKNGLSLFYNSDVGRNLNILIDALSKDLKNSSEVLKKLQSDPQECVKELTYAFEKLPESEYNARWFMVYCIAQFELPEFIRPLSRIAMSEIPNEMSKTIHLFSTVAEETAIRLTAIDGIRSIVQKGYKEGEIELFDLLKSKYLTLNIATCQSLIAINTENKAKIFEILPKEKQFIIDIRPKEVKDITIIKNIQEDIALNDKYVQKPQEGKSEVRKFSKYISISKPPKIL
ncbi:MAG: hypothetical protein ABI184_06745 [Ginsengibacter sp.]